MKKRTLKFPTLILMGLLLTQAPLAALAAYDGPMPVNPDVKKRIAEWNSRAQESKAKSGKIECAQKHWVLVSSPALASDAASLQAKVCSDVESAEIKRLRAENEALKAQLVAGHHSAIIKGEPKSASLFKELLARKAGQPFNTMRITKFDQLRSLLDKQSLAKLVAHDLRLIAGKSFQEKIKEFSNAELLTLLRVAKADVINTLKQNPNGESAEDLAAKIAVQEAELKNIESFVGRLQPAEQEEYARLAEETKDPSQWISFGDEIGGSDQKIILTTIQSRLGTVAGAHVALEGKKSSAERPEISVEAVRQIQDKKIKDLAERRARIAQGAWWEQRIDDLPKEGQLTAENEDQSKVIQAMSHSERQLFADYTSDRHHQNIDDYLQTGKKAGSKDPEKLSSELSQAIAKLPAVSGITYYTGKLPAGISKESLQSGATLNFPQFLLTNKDKKVALSLQLEGSEKDIESRWFFVIQGKSGRDIQDLATRFQRKEVIMDKGSSFQIKAVDGKNIYLEEVTPATR